MGRSKEMGKPVQELTSAELVSEQQRCREWLTVRRHPSARKAMEQRLRQIEGRLEMEAK